MSHTQPLLFFILPLCSLLLWGDSFMLKTPQMHLV
jgi:hypothetical protein